MAIKKYVAISYCFAFLFVYFSSIAYGLLSTSINENFNTQLPQTATMNATSSAISSFSSWGGTLVTVGIATLIIAIILIIISSRTMGMAIYKLNIKEQKDNGIFQRFIF